MRWLLFIALVCISPLLLISCKSHAHWEAGRCLASHVETIPVVGFDAQGDVTTHFAFNTVCDMRAPPICRLGDYGETECPTQ